jgi:hypothetical protein
MTYQMLVMYQDIMNLKVSYKMIPWYEDLGILLGAMALEIATQSVGLYLVDLIHGFRLLDYIQFSLYRHRTRKEEWIFTSYTLNISLDKIYRSLDCLYFTDQYYFLVAVSTCGGFLIILGLQILTINQYNIFNDPFSILMFFLMTLVGRIARFISKVVQSIFKPWSKEKSPDEKQFNTTMNLENYMLKNWNIYEHDVVRHHLIKQKKEWVIENLPNILKPDHFKDNNGFLIKVYKRLEDIIKKEEIEILRSNLISKNTFIPKPKSLEAQNAIIHSSKEEFVRLLCLMQYWKILAREALYYRTLIERVKTTFLASYCSKCRTDDDLLVHEEKTLYEVMSKFRVRMAGLVSTNHDWIEFYKESQVFTTLCSNCYNIHKIKSYLDANKSIAEGDKSSIISFAQQIKEDSKKPKKLYKEIIMGDLKGKFKAIMLNWVLQARSRVLHSKRVEQDEGKVEEMNVSSEGEN